MYAIQQITSAPTQTMTLILPSGQTANLTIQYAAQQYCWFILSLTYAPLNFTLQGVQITANPNMLNQWRNSLPFGLGCFVNGNREPTQLQDFSSGNAQLFILTQAEVASYWAYLQAGVTAP
jgi:hypothetical protein